ncbi:MAG: M56 family metallopeptidase [Terriglobales bacterium]
MMDWSAVLELQTLAQFSAGRMLNGVAEGTALAAGAWMLLRVVRRPNSSTRFAVWFAVLLVTAALPFIGALRGGDAAAGSASSPSLITLPGWWAICGLAVWAALAGMGLARVGAGFWQLRRLRRECTALDLNHLDPAMRKTIEEFQRFRPVKLCTSERVKVPTAIGFIQPAVIVPAWALRELSAEELHSVVLHELAHLRRWDDWTNLAQEVLGALFFFHPAVWWIGSRLSLEREMACDDLVLAQTANPRAYAQCLVSVAEKSLLRRGLALAQAAVSRMRHTSLRVARILDRNRPGATRVWKPAVGLVGVFSAVCLIALARTPQLVAFRTEVPGVRVETATGIAPAPVATAIAAPVIPASWKSPAIAPPRSAHPQRQKRLAIAEKPVPGTTLGFVVDFRPELVVVVVEPHSGAGLGPKVWRIDVYELRVFYPASHAARQPISAKI